MKKYLVLGILFLLPITAYIFFASGVNNFAKLPVLTQGVVELDGFTTIEGDPVQLNDHITVLCFFGKEPLSKDAVAYNLTHKIYKKNFQFEDFQFVILIPEGAEASAKILKEKLEKIEDSKRWKFAVGSPEAIQQVFNSLNTTYKLDEDLATPYVFIIDKENNLRGRDQDEDEAEGILYGFDARSIAEINNKMSDDIKVVLAEYRLALKKYGPKREI